MKMSFRVKASIVSVLFGLSIGVTSYVFQPAADALVWAGLAGFFCVARYERQRSKMFQRAAELNIARARRWNYRAAEGARRAAASYREMWGSFNA